MARDELATAIKHELDGAEFAHRPISPALAKAQIVRSDDLEAKAALLARFA